jgi:thioredoxin reductase (NADPH)
MNYDSIIIGGGPAGISASLYLKRANKNVLVLYSGESNLEKAEKIENYYGFPEGISGKDLLENGRKQAQNLGIDLKEEVVTGIEFVDDKTFKVVTDVDSYETRSAVLATGNKKNRPNIKGLLELEGKGISYCAVCDGFFYRNKKVAILGNGKYALSEAKYLKNIANEVVVITNGEDSTFIEENVREDNNVSVINKKISNIEGNERIENIIFEDNEQLDLNGLFVALGEADASDFAKQLGIITKNNKIEVDEKMKTNINGIYAIGDATLGMNQVARAVYDGATAGFSIIEYLSK